MRSRDEKIVSLASTLNLDGYDQGPFSTSVVKQFLTQVAQLRQELEERAASEKVRERERDGVHFIAMDLSDHTVKFGSEGVDWSVEFDIL